MNENPTAGVLDTPPTQRAEGLAFRSAEPPKKSALWSALAALPNLLILALLAAVGWWGHHSGWELPKFSRLAGTAVEGKDDWCAEHGVPESDCIECDASLMPRRKPHGWCKVHGVHECPFEHPEIAELKSPPTITPAMLERARRALKVEFAQRPVNKADPACTCAASSSPRRRPSRRPASTSSPFRRPPSSRP